ncbi:RNA polymerase sigma factor [Blastopirellula retiformator]|uniref:RNA polymerase sigma factor n=1 Tax=Blastopirellula retiformator TaxID=2527970 RepID=UPI0011B53E74|nr:RNA polymerase sigma factor [Blastopirellula retiformator]
MPISSDQFERLIHEHSPALYRVAFRMLGDRHLAEDVLQEAFRSVWTGRAKLDPERSERAWLASILRRRIIDRWRKKSDVKSVGDSEMLDRASFDVDPFGDELSSEMQAALERLPTELKETLLLVVVGELTHREAAETLGVPIGTVLSRVNRARGRLREYLSARQPK